jgi:hypothetical protein
MRGSKVHTKACELEKTKGEKSCDEENKERSCQQGWETPIIHLGTSFC